MLTWVCKHTQKKIAFIFINFTCRLTGVFCKIKNEQLKNFLKKFHINILYLIDHSFH